ncbi:MAG: alpha/beta fold hydrolase [Gammaproteobacteria bacterium]
MNAFAVATGFVPGTPKLAYDHAGDGPVVVFMHGIGGFRGNWQRQLEVLAPEFHAVAWDARGYGESDDYEGELAFSDFAADLERLLDHLGADRAHLCGLSMGGRIALDFYERYADRVRSLILVDTFPGFDSSFTAEGRERFIRERREPLLNGKEVSDIAPLVAPTLVSPAAPDAVVQELVDSMCRLHKLSYIKAIEAMTRYEPVTDCTRVEVPTQIIVGADDKLTPPAISKQMANDIPGARLLVIDECGHLSNLERPEAFNACLLEFLRGVA